MNAATPTGSLLCVSMDPTLPRSYEHAITGAPACPQGRAEQRPLSGHEEPAKGPSARENDARNPASVDARPATHNGDPRAGRRDRRGGADRLVVARRQVFPLRRRPK